MNEFKIQCVGCKEVFILRRYEYENLKMQGKWMIFDLYNFIVALSSFIV